MGYPLKPLAKPPQMIAAQNVAQQEKAEVQEVEKWLQEVKNKAYATDPHRMVKNYFKEKLQKYKKPGALVQGAVSTAVEFIPIPVVGAAVGWTQEKVTELVRNKYREYRQNKGSSEGDEYVKMKFDLKTLSVEDVERYRKKTKDNLDELKQLRNMFNGTQPCRSAYLTTYRYYRLINRTEKLRARAKAMIDIADEIVKWTDEILNSKINDPTHVRDYVLALMRGSHSACKSNECYLENPSPLYHDVSASDDD